jgi:hypothetical protein
MKVEAKGEVKAEVQVQDRIELLIVGGKVFSQP